MQRHGLTREEALSQIQQARPICEPNEGFWKQLELYHDMATPQNVDEHPAYQRWLYQREIELSRACGQAPEAEKIRFEDEHVHAQAETDFEMRCRKCRHVLALRIQPIHQKPSLTSIPQTPTSNLPIPPPPRPPPPKHLRSNRLPRPLTTDTLLALLPRPPLLDETRARTGQTRRPARVPEVQGQCGQVCVAGHAV